MHSLPPDALVPVAKDVADRLWRAAVGTRRPSDLELRQTGVQATLRHEIHDADPHGFDTLRERIVERVSRPPYLAVVKGLRFDDEHRLFAAVVTTLGDAVEPYETEWSRLVREIRPRTDRATGAWGVLNERLHTDGTDWEDPNTFTCLQCVRDDPQGGGRSQSIGVDEIREETEHILGGEALSELAEPFPWALSEALGGGVCHRPILDGGGIRWLRFTIEEAARRGAGLDGSRRALLTAFEDLLARSEATLDFALSPGDLLVLNNRRCLHARTPIPDASNSSRLVLRIKLRQRHATEHPGRDA